ncbi:MAG: PAS domain S-box protein, partial [Pirellulaceae bacterium]|nr:PAS domain S-box protein [Pirellulaceae bacterium]
MKSNPVTRNEIRKSLSDAGSIRWFHGGLVFITLAATFVAWDYARDQSQEQVRSQFELEADRVLDLLSERMSRYQQTLLAGAAFIETIDHELTSDDWTRFVGAMEIENRYPAMQGMGVVYHLRRSEVDTFVQRQRQNRPDFAIHPESTREEIWPVVYISPIQGNEQVIGLDTAHEANRLAAAQATRDTGNAHITAPIELVQDAIGEPGFLLFAPIYKTSKHDTSELRREHFAGLVYSPLLMSELIDAVINDPQRQVALRIHDGQRLLYADQGIGRDGNLRSSLQHTERRQIHGRMWKLDVVALPSFQADVSIFQPAMILAMGLLINAMLIGLLFAIARASRRALDLSDKMTSDLEKLALAAEINEIGVWDFDPVTGTLDWDDTMFKVYGRRREDFSGAYEAWYESLHVDDRESATKALEESLKSDHPFVTEFRVVHLDGSVHHLSARGVVFRDESGTPIRMLGANSDITKLHEVTDHLEKSRELHAAMQDAAGVAMIATDVDGLITQFNHAAEIMLGYSADEMIGRETPAVFHDANEIGARSAEMKKEGHPVEPGFDVFVDAARRGEMDQREWIYVRKDGSRLPVLLTVTALRTKQKEIYGFLGCAANISERKRAMEI